MAAPRQPLPYGPQFKTPEEYISSLLTFTASSHLHQSLCGGVHILDFLTRTPDLYSELIPSEWRTWFSSVNIDDILDLLLREDIPAITNKDSWQEYTLPPASLLDFISQIRNLCLDRTHHPSSPMQKLNRHIAVGMTAKKEHEVSHFAAFISDLTTHLSTPPSGAQPTCNQPSNTHKISHLVDFGSGQNYLGRVLAGPQYERNVVALESRVGNIDGARKMDVHAKLAKKPVVWRNKKMWKEEGRDTAEEDRLAGVRRIRGDVDDEMVAAVAAEKNSGAQAFGSKVSDDVQRRITYIEHIITNGDLSDVTRRVRSDAEQVTNGHTKDPEFLVMSLHSCGNLVHHGLRSLILNPSVKAVAMIGCCYNLCTERLGPPTYKLPSLQYRAANPRLIATSLTCDPHGFPMSKRFLEYSHAETKGTRFNITARMMAVQAPASWTKDECDGFFTRHFYRALLQRIFLDIGFVGPPVPADEVIGGSARGWTGGTEPIIIGSLSKSCYKSFVAYVRGAVRKIITINPDQGIMLRERMLGMTDEMIAGYEQKYIHKRHELCIVWSLMAFAAQVVECAIVADRWQFLVEQEDIATAWVQTVFEYQKSPRNLVIVGIKK